MAGQDAAHPGAGGPKDEHLLGGGGDGAGCGGVDEVADLAQGRHGGVTWQQRFVDYGLWNARAMVLFYRMQGLQVARDIRGGP
jgi:hypothetical protein